ncbi:unnamed protein product [Prorocentrum cordatum]|uniref:Uncharacterized protein n=1 Tax=Prorocentrum cordatum TaxID=2364126 RepID=A0ABN9Y0A6_9DINO|nr:unnamed protein product [Polarella glacialis]
MLDSTPAAGQLPAGPGGFAGLAQEPGWANGLRALVGPCLHEHRRAPSFTLFFFAAASRKGSGVLAQSLEEGRAAIGAASHSTETTACARWATLGPATGVSAALGPASSPEVLDHALAGVQALGCLFFRRACPDWQAEAAGLVALAQSAAPPRSHRRAIVDRQWWQGNVAAEDARCRGPSPRRASPTRQGSVGEAADVVFAQMSTDAAGQHVNLYEVLSCAALLSLHLRQDQKLVVLALLWSSQQDGALGVSQACSLLGSVLLGLHRLGVLLHSPPQEAEIVNDVCRLLWVLRRSQPARDDGLQLEELLLVSRLDASISRVLGAFSAPGAAGATPRESRAPSVAPARAGSPAPAAGRPLKAPVRGGGGRGSGGGGLPLGGHGRAAQAPGRVSTVTASSVMSRREVLEAFGIFQAIAAEQAASPVAEHVVGWGSEDLRLTVDQMLAYGVVSPELAAAALHTFGWDPSHVVTEGDFLTLFVPCDVNDPAALEFQAGFRNAWMNLHSDPEGSMASPVGSANARSWEFGGDDFAEVLCAAPQPGPASVRPSSAPPGLSAARRAPVAAKPGAAPDAGAAAASGYPRPRPSRAGGGPPAAGGGTPASGPVPAGAGAGAAEAEGAVPVPAPAGGSVGGGAAETEEAEPAPAGGAGAMAGADDSVGIGSSGSGAAPGTAARTLVEAAGACAECEEEDEVAGVGAEVATFAGADPEICAEVEDDVAEEALEEQEQEAEEAVEEQEQEAVDEEQKTVDVSATACVASPASQSASPELEDDEAEVDEEQDAVCDSAAACVSSPASKSAASYAEESFEEASSAGGSSPGRGAPSARGEGAACDGDVSYEDFVRRAAETRPASAQPAPGTPPTVERPSGPPLAAPGTPLAVEVFPKPAPACAAQGPVPSTPVEAFAAPRAGTATPVAVEFPAGHMPVFAGGAPAAVAAPFEFGEALHLHGAATQEAAQAQQQAAACQLVVLQQAGLLPPTPVLALAWQAAQQQAAAVLLRQQQQQLEGQEWQRALAEATLQQPPPQLEDQAAEWS